MNELISIRSDNLLGQEVKTVDARKLHKTLNSKRQFANWIQAKVLDNPFFMENQDYILLNNPVKQNGSGGHNRKDYALTVDTAKKIAMSEQTAAGDKIRDYFLECEEKAKSSRDPMVALNDPAAMRSLLLTYTEKVITLEDETVGRVGQELGEHGITREPAYRCPGDCLSASSHTVAMMPGLQ